MTMGECLKVARMSAGMTQVELSEESGVSQALISIYENDRCVPQIDAAIAIADSLEMSLHECFAGVPCKYTARPLTQRQIGENARSARKSKHYSGKKLAEEAGINHNVPYTIETALKLPRISTVLKCAEALGMSADEYIGRV